MKKRAFTLAETLITLSIIGVVAVLTITTFVKNYQEKAWKTSAEVFNKKLTDAIDLMNTNDELAGYSTTEDFVNAFSKYAKIIKTCDESNLNSCWKNGDVEESNTITIAQSSNCSDSKVSIIRAVRTCTGFGLKEANDIVNNACNGTPQAIECDDEASINELVSYGATAKYSDAYKLKKLEFSKYVLEPSYDIAQLINKLGSKVQAIKFVKECANLGLKEAKELVDAGGIVNCQNLNNVTIIDTNILNDLTINYNQINRKEKATTSVMGAVFADGTQALIIYNENCEKIDLKHSECVGVIYDTSGLKNPNYIGKDRGILIK